MALDPRASICDSFARKPGVSKAFRRWRLAAGEGRKFVISASSQDSAPTNSQQLQTAPVFRDSSVPELVPADSGSAANWYLRNLANLREVKDEELGGEVRSKCVFCQATNLLPANKASNPFSGKPKRWEEMPYLTEASEEGIFYIMSRGIPLDDAENLMLSGTCKRMIPELPVTLTSTASDLLSFRPDFALYGNPDVAMFLDNRPLRRGHVLAIPLGHFSSISDLPHDTAGPLFYLMARMGTAVAKAVGADDYIVFHASSTFKRPLAPGEEAEIISELFGKLKTKDGDDVILDDEIPHLHFHIVPRFGTGELWQGANMRKEPLDLKDAARLARLINIELNKYGADQE